LSLANIDSIEFNEKEMRLKIFLDESDGHAWLDIKGDE
jgi:hypothetical protein